MTPGDVVTLLGALAIIVLMLAGTWHATRWYARKAGGFAAGTGRYIRVIDQARLGTGSLVIVEAGGAYY
ncbi:MAG: flagellar biosynthetic protein FliO, partial [Oscillospiraceae bacterium]|nr:flagellar biosynthetic protein FliO [Oscillospiraceae bacterium]